MVSSTKILTVSYGTFSCTAEGFEDPLAVVKETTQFFRGVVRDDRFFGAEPPQVDQALAGELLQRQIAADRAETGLYLRPASQTAPAALGAAMAATPKSADSETAAPATGSGAPDAQLDEQDASEHSAQANDALGKDAAQDSLDHEADGPESEDDGIPGGWTEPALTAATAAAAVTGGFSLGDRLQRIRDAVADPQDDEVSDSPAAVATAETAGDTLDSLLAHGTDAADDTETADAPDTEHDLTGDPDLSALLADTGDSAGGVASAAADVPVAEADASDETAQDDAPLVLQDPALPDTQDGSKATDDLPAAAQGAEAQPAAPAPEATTSADRTDTPNPPVEKPRVRARVIKVKRASLDKAVASGALEPAQPAPVPAAPAPAPAQASRPAPDPASAKDTGLSPEEEAELARELEAVKAELSGDWDHAHDRADSNVFKAWQEDETADPVQNTHATAMQDPDNAFDDPEEDPEADIGPLRLDNPVAQPDRGWDTDLDALDARAEQQLRAAPIADEDAADDFDEDTVRKTVKLASPGRAMLTEGSVDDGDDTSRILDETNRELEEPEGNRRRSAIAHLRAAVAATRADRLLGRKPDETAESEPYREDLATVVRPRRPQPAGQTERPERPDPGAAPLKLVSEQRVGEAAAAQPVRPRRIRRPALDGVRSAKAGPADDDKPTHGGGFAQYAESVGANDLPELLEAAAAYMSFVEGIDQFSRPQLMTTVRQAERGESSREDRLRSFGQLLREGKIEKTRGGRFTASERISFKPPQAAAS